jgi:hypothetical protein
MNHEYTLAIVDGRKIDCTAFLVLSTRTGGVVQVFFRRRLPKGTPDDYFVAHRPEVGKCLKKMKLGKYKAAPVDDQWGPDAGIACIGSYEDAQTPELLKVNNFAIFDDSGEIRFLVRLTHGRTAVVVTDPTHADVSQWMNGIEGM